MKKPRNQTRAENNKFPSEMTPEERVHELISILAAGFIKLNRVPTLASEEVSSLKPRSQR